VFVGNLSLDTSSKELKEHFKGSGTIEKIWFRSIALEHDSKLPQKAKIIKEMYGKQKDNKNAYILFST